MFSLFRRNARQAKPARRISSPVHLRLEALEDRCLMSAGALDPTFGSGGVVTTPLSKYEDTASAVLIQPNGKIVDAGSAGGRRTVTLALVRYNADGTLDSTFGSGGKAISKFGGYCYGAALDPGITDASGNEAVVMVSGNTVARFNPNGSLDTNFGNKGEVTLSYRDFSGVVVQEVNGSYEIVVMGDNGATSGGVGTDIHLTRLTPSGKVDTTFGTGGTATLSTGLAAESLALQSDGKLVVGAVPFATGTQWEVARFTANGQLDTSFGSGAGYVTTSFTTSAGTQDVVTPPALAIYPSTGSDAADAGKIVVSGSISGNMANGGINGSQGALARLNPDGSLDSTFGSGGQVVTPFPNSGEIAAPVSLQGDGKIVVAGTTASNGNWNFSLLRYNTDGSLDTTFSNSYGQQIFPNGGLVVTPSGTPDSRAFAVAIQSDARIVAAGRVEVAAGSGDYNFMTARYLASEPVIGSLTANQSAAGAPVSLTASNITDGNPNSTITQVTFYYYDSNGNKVVLGNGTEDSSGDWTLTVNLAPGTYTLYAQAEDNYGVLSDPAALTLTVQ